MTPECEPSHLERRLTGERELVIASQLAGLFILGVKIVLAHLSASAGRAAIGLRPMIALPERRLQQSQRPDCRKAQCVADVNTPMTAMPNDLIFQHGERG